MNAPHDPDDEARQADILTGPDATAKGADPELVELARALDAAGRAGRAELQQVLAEEPRPEDIAAARRARERLLHVHRPSRRRWLWPLVSAAAALLTLAVWLTIPRGEAVSQPGDFILGGERSGLRADIGPDGSIRGFSWPHAQDAAAYFTVRVFAYDPSTQQTGDRLLTSPELIDPRWQLTDEERARLRGHDKVRWEVDVWVDGEQIDTSSRISPP